MDKVNKAKCLVCNDVIESLTESDAIVCTCGEISVMGGDAMQCAARNWSNFLRIDADGNEIVPAVEQPTRRQDLINELHRLIDSYDALPDRALAMPVTHYDLASSLRLLCAILDEPSA